MQREFRQFTLRGSQKPVAAGKKAVIKVQIFSGQSFF